MKRCLSRNRKVRMLPLLMAHTLAAVSENRRFCIPLPRAEAKPGFLSGYRHGQTESCPTGAR